MFTMINNEKFVLRLQKVIDFYDESASSFAEKVGVQRSSISHILSGRNKPSLDFVMKVLKAFPEVNLYWLLNGKGDFPTQQPISTIDQNDVSKTISENSILSDKAIERIVIFFKDGSFKSYQE